VQIDEQARVRKQATLEEGAQILGSGRVGRETTVGAGAIVRGRVGARATIQGGAVVQDGARVDRGATVCSGATVFTGEVARGIFPDSECAAITSCLAIYQANNTVEDGVYSIDPDGPGGAEPFDAYCDMANGGWTLALRSGYSGDTFRFLSPHWTTASTLNPTVLDPTANTNSKFPAFNTVVGDEIRGCLAEFGTFNSSYGCKAYDLSGPQTLLELFRDTPIGSRDSGGAYFFDEAQSQKLEWVTMWGRSTTDLSSDAILYTDTGINIDDDQSNYRARVRFGLAVNNQTNIFTLNDTAGFGASSFHIDTEPGLVESDWRISTGGAFGSTTIDTSGQIWVR